jgi:hypothetical protein
MKTTRLFNRLKSALSSIARATGRALLLLLDQLHKLGRSRLARAIRRPLLVVGRDAGLAALIAVLLLFAASFSFVKVQPGTVAVRQANWGSDSGIEQEDHPPGLYFSPRFLESWHHLDTRTHTVSFSWESEGGQFPILEVRTREGNSAQVAVTVPFRIVAGEAYRIVEDGIKLSWERRVRTTVEKALLEELAQLGSDDFANTDRRLEVCATALKKLNSQLASHHVEADGVFITGVYFPSTYEKKRQQRQLESQTEKTDAVLAQLKSKRLEKDFTAQELDRRAQELVAELDRQFEAERVKTVESSIENQKLENEFLVQSLAREKQEWIDELTIDYKKAQREEYELPLQEQQLALSASTQRIAREVLDATLEMDRSFEDERLERGVRRLQAQRTANELAAQELAREEQELIAVLDRELAAEGIAHRETILELQRESHTETERRRHAAELTYEERLAEGALALDKAEMLREGLRAEALATPGGRLYLAREAATKLNFGKVVLNSNDPRVPSVLDLDQLVGLLVGKEPEE